MEETWVKIQEFPSYAISSHGRVRNDETRRLVKISHTKQGAAKVGFFVGGKQSTRSVKVLVAEAFIEPPNPKFNTPIHLDGDQDNLCADNLVWRPRWFAWKYHRQFETLDEYAGLGPICDRDTGLIYKDIVEAALMNGLLFSEISLSLLSNILVFPTWQRFDWVKN